MKPKTLRTLPDLRREMAAWRDKGLRYAVVPTMGAIHEGHMQLVREGLRRADRVVTTIFINPKQFAAHEDLDKYPRDEPGDLLKLGKAGSNAVYLPRPGDIYPPGFSTSVSLTGPARAGLEDRFRPHFFTGVATIVAKLLVQTGADLAMFGEKDYQQLRVVTRMARDLDLPTEVIGIPTVREDDGLAMSSRNVYLSIAERRRATAIFQNLNLAADAIRNGRVPSQAAAQAARRLRDQGFKIDYVTARNAETLARPSIPGERLRLLAAAWNGKTRLIDNIAV
jgi:pantoate--beta-alanine ligase